MTSQTYFPTKIKATYTSVGTENNKSDANTIKSPKTEHLADFQKTDEPLRTFLRTTLRASLLP